MFLGTMRTLLVSIRPQYAELIFAGAKTVELRRTRPNVTKGDTIAIYVSAPVRALQGTGTISGVHQATPTELWALVGHRSGLMRSEFMEYFAGVQSAYGILLAAIERLPFARSLKQLRTDIPGFCPPQVYRYLNPLQIELLGVTHAANRHRAAA